LDVSSLPDGRGVIVFDEKEMSPKKRTFWTLEKAGEMRFSLENSKLRPHFYITISGFKTTVHEDSFEEDDEAHFIKFT